MLLVLKQPDLGTALTYFPVLVAGLFLGGIKFRQVAILLLGFTVLIGGAWLSGKRLKPYQQAHASTASSTQTPIRKAPDTKSSSP